MPEALFAGRGPSNGKQALSWSLPARPEGDQFRREWRQPGRNQIGIHKIEIICFAGQKFAGKVVLPAPFGPANAFAQIARALNLPADRLIADALRFRTFFAQTFAFIRFIFLIVSVEEHPF